MDRFINRQNIDRYRRLAGETTDATERRQIMRLLAEEEAKLRPDQAGGDVDNTRQPEAGNTLADGARTR